MYNMNIVIIPAFFYTKKRPTLGYFFWEQAKALQKLGHSVTILYCDTYSVKMLGDYLQYEEEEQSLAEGIIIYRKKIFCPFKHGIEGHRKQFVRGILDLYKKYIRNEKIDLVHAHCCVWAGAAANVISSIYHIPYCITEHATLFQLHQDSLSKKNKAKIRKYFTEASKVICVSSEFKKLLQEYRIDIEIIGNVVDCDLFTPVSKWEHPKIYTFFTLCYMEEEAQLYKKGMDILVQAYSRISSKIPCTRLVIGGGGKAQKTLQDWFNQTGIKMNVCYLGNLSRNAVALWMQQADCFVLPSRYETFGVAYIEAMACGKPVIGVRNGGPDEFINSENGLLISAESVEELVQSMQYMIQHSNDYRAEQIAENIRIKYSGSAIANQLEDLYQSMIM